MVLYCKKFIIRFIKYEFMYFLFVLFIYVIVVGIVMVLGIYFFIFNSKFYLKDVYFKN